ncbi:MAG TPA: hypothetical protein VFA26_01635 [Gemmataceae bacterium]|nr:hypothetical protein [Gemmataceae bacterium]
MDVESPGCTTLFLEGYYMAKQQAEAANRSAFWRELFTNHKELLEARSNNACREYFRQAHGREMDEKDNQAMTNVKADLRKKFGIRAKGKKRKRAAKGAAPVAADAATAHKVSLSSLEQLEIAIDNCLSMARHLDPERLDKAIRSLRAARNNVVYLQGE